MGNFKLKSGILLGCASSATQIDGGNFGHTWNNWFRKKMVSGGLDPAVAAGHWERWREDIMLMRRMGLETARFSVEWARIEPTEGVFDDLAISHIKEEVLLMRGLGIQPLLTLHNFTNPIWFEEKGGWEDPGNIRFFLEYVEKLTRALGHLVSEYITFEEPNLYAVNGYYLGIWPPGKRSIIAAAQVMSVMAAAHTRCYRLIHDLRRNLCFDNTKVSAAINMRLFEPKNPANPAHIASRAIFENFFQTAIIKAVATGKFAHPLKNLSRARAGRYCDFFAINYDTQVSISGLKGTVPKGSSKDDLGTPIYPEGMIRCAEKLMEYCSIPIYITANGTCDNSDRFRSRFIYEHLKAICSSDLPVRRYYYRSFIDGFEWQHGDSARYGLVHTDFKTMERTVKKSGEFFSAIISGHGVTDETFENFVAGQIYNR